MPLTSAEKDVLRHETMTRWRDVLDAYFQEKNSFANPTTESLGLSTDQVEATRIKKLAKALLEARVSAFVDVFNRYQKYPDDEEYRLFIDESHPLIVEGSMTRFEEACRSFYANPAHETVAKAIRYSLPMELQVVFAKGVQPVTSFYLEGKAMEKSYDDTAFEILGVLKENGVNETMKISDLATRVGLSEDELWIYLKDFQNHGWVGLLMGGFVDLYFEGASAYLRAKSRSYEPTAEIKSGDTFHTHNYGPSTNQIGGSENVQIVSNVNPDISSALNAIAELVRTSALSELDKEEIFDVAERINELSQREQKPEVIERTKKWFDWLTTTIQVGELTTKAAPLIEQLGRALGF